MAQICVCSFSKSDRDRRCASYGRRVVVFAFAREQILQVESDRVHDVVGQAADSTFNEDAAVFAQSNPQARVLVAVLVVMIVLGGGR